jgi:hypothetical protein
MLPGASHQHDIAIALLIVFGIQFCVASGYLLPKLYKKVGSPASWGRRFTRRLALRSTARRDEGAGITGIAGGPSAGDAGKAAEPSEKVEITLADLQAIIERGNASSAAGLTEILSEVRKTNTGVTDIGTKLKEAGHAALLWNISSLVFGAAGVVLGVLALNLRIPGRGP